MILVIDTKHLEKLCKELENEEYITVDTEFLRDKFYYSKLCLVQVASENTEFAVDPLADGIDLSPLFELFRNDKIVKVFHSARQDIEIVINMSGSIPVPLFDTQVAAMVCGFGASASYATLVSEIVGKTVDKSSRFTDWSRRPLSKDQLDYAISDVTHLRDVYKYLSSELKKRDRQSWLDEEMTVLNSPDTYKVNPDEAWRKIKTRGGSRRFLAVIKELAKWRELTAQKLNRPKTFILKDQALLEMAAVAPSNPEELKKIRGVGSLKPTMAIEILNAVEVAKQIPDSDLPKVDKYKKPSKTNESLIELMKVLLKAKCAEFQVAERMVATKDDLIQIVSGEDSKVFHGWRYDVFGKDAQSLKKGDISLSVHSGRINILNRKCD